ncbi:MAG TPA: flagellar hook-associated protein 3 [Sedimenticola sp.]|nr:flagellar hook-associated protein 3 [Sedimenticola sp.]
MRISTSLLYQRATIAILDQQAKMAQTELQLASGKKVLKPSDDPAAATRILDLNRYIDTIEQYQDNAGVAEARLELEESTLASATELMQRAYELAVQGNNDSLNAGDRQALAKEVDQLQEALLGLANTKDANGEYLFSGFQRDTRPFNDLGGGRFGYNGDQGQRLLRISADRQVADNESGFEVFMDVPSSGGGAQSAFASLYNLSQALKNDLATTTSIDDVRSAMDKFLQVRAQAGARLNAVREQKDANEAFKITIQTQLSKEEDLDYAEAVSRFNQETLALQAAQQAYLKMQGLSLFNYM